VRTRPKQQELVRGSPCARAQFRKSFLRLRWASVHDGDNQRGTAGLEVACHRRSAIFNLHRQASIFNLPRRAERFVVVWRKREGITMTELPSVPLASEERESRPRPRQDWRKKFRVALRGLKLGIRGQSSFFVHFFFAALVIAAAIVLDCGFEQWCLLFLCIGLVLTAELFNSAVEVLFRGLDEETRQRTWPALDIAAGAVFMASVIAVAVGCIIFATQLLNRLWGG
jgi:diacylglycerol kinase